MEKETGKQTYEDPTVQKVEFDFKTRIAASGCIYSGELCEDKGGPLHSD